MKQQAVKDLKKVAVMFSGIVALSEEIEKLGSLEQCVEEAESRVRVLQARETELDRILEAHKGDITKARVQADAIRTTTKESADQVLAEASRNAVEIQDAAHAAAKQIAEETESALSSTKAEIHAAKKKLTEIVAAVTNAQSQLESLNAGIAKMKEKVAGI